MFSMDSKEAVASNSEGNREAKKVTDCAKPSESNARADSINARAIVNDPRAKIQQSKEEAKYTIDSTHVVGNNDARGEEDATDGKSQNTKKKRKKRKKKKKDSETVSAMSANTSCDAMEYDCDVTKSTSPDSAKQLSDFADKEEHDCIDSEFTASQDQPKADSKKKSRSRRRQGKSAQLGEEPPPFQETELPVKETEEIMAKGDDASSNFADSGEKEDRQDLPTTENTSGSKRKRNRRRKANKVQDGEEASEGISHHDLVGNYLHRRQEPNDSVHHGEVSAKDSETRNANQSTPNTQKSRNSTRRTPSSGNKKQKPLYEKYWSLERVSDGLKRGELVKGILRISPRNYELAWVTVPGLKRDVLLEGMLNRNRALNNDVVALKIYPKDKWKIMLEELEYNGLTGENTEHNHVDRLADSLDSLAVSPANVMQSPSARTVRIENKAGHTPESRRQKHYIDVNQVPDEFLQRRAKVVYIIEKKHSRVASGHLKPFPHPKERPDGCFSPIDSRLPRFRIPRDNCPPGFFNRPRDFENTLHVARIVSWPENSSRDSFLAIGSISRSLGEAGEIEPETEGILLEYGIDSGPFSDEALACLPQETPWKVPCEELKYRRDFRDDCVFTIDPLTARDLDDAVHCKKLADDLFEVGVHIADVSFFVRSRTALDEVAAERATSTYMVQKVVPMLPRRLCEELCSLNPGEDRLTISIVWKMTSKGEIIEDWKGRGIIRSRIKMAYEHAQDMIDKPNRKWNENELPPISDGATAEEISAQVNQLHKFAIRLRRNRLENGALRLDQAKLRFDLDKETGMPSGYHVHKQRDSNRLIEEFMLLANMAIAHHIYRSYPETALLRRHPKPHQKQLDDLLELCRSLGIEFNTTSSKTIHESLAQFPLSSPEREVLVNLAMRPMKNAEYFCTGCVDDGEYGHYALSVPLYTHFTSPIRRYADVVVHRLLAASLGIDEPLDQDPSTIDMIAHHCNDRKLAAKRAGELSTEMFFGIFVRESGPLEKDGIVLNVMDQSVDVLVPELGMVKRVYMKFCPGVKRYAFTKGEKGKPAELRLLWSGELNWGDVIHEEEQMLKTFNTVRVILTTESETESKTANPFKVMAKLAPPLKCGDEFYIPSTPATEKSLKKRGARGHSEAAGVPNSTDDVRKKLFVSEGSDAIFKSKKAQEVDSLHVNQRSDEEETGSYGSDDVIVEDEEANEGTNLADDDSDDVIVESESDNEGH